MDYSREALDQAVREGCVKHLRQFLDQNTERKHKSWHTGWLIDIAIKFDHIEIIKLLLGYGALDHDEDSEITLKIFLFLLKDGYSLAQDRVEVLEILLDHGSSIDEFIDNCSTMLHLAVEKQRFDLVISLFP